MSEDPNVLGAKLIKAELLGDEELVRSLKARLEKAREQADAKKAEEKESKSKADAESKQGAGSKSKDDHHSNKQQHHHHHKSHNRQSHNRSHGFDRKDLDSHDARILKRNYKFNADDEYDELAGPSNNSMENKKMKKKDHRFESNDTKNAFEKFGQKEAKSSDKCEFCLDNAQKHLIASIGKHCYLVLPSEESITEGNCLIVPINHCSCSVTCDEEVLEEIREFKKALIKMFDKKLMDCVFTELYIPGRSSHMTIECIPLGRDVSNMAPIYFKKALIESESEWAQNKSIIEIKNQELRKLIPKSMSYYAVTFDLDEGYAHIIENSERFPDHFGKEIIGGILDLDPFLWRRPRREDFTRQSKKVIEFLKWWKNYDFNKK